MPDVTPSGSETPSGAPTTHAAPGPGEAVRSRLTLVPPWMWPVILVVSVAASSSISRFATAAYLAALAGALAAVLVDIGLDGVRQGRRLAGVSGAIVSAVTLFLLLDQIGRPLLGL